MNNKIQVDIEEVRRVFALLEKMNDLFHQPMKYTDIDIIKSFADSNYEEIKDLYYDIVWDWLPEDIKDEIENS